MYHFMQKGNRWPRSPLDQQVTFKVLKTIVCLETRSNGPVDLLAKDLETIFQPTFFIHLILTWGIIHKLGLMNDSTQELDKDFSKDWRKGCLWRLNHWYLILPLSCRVTNPPHNFTLVQGPIISPLEIWSRLRTPPFPILPRHIPSYSPSMHSAHCRQNAVSKVQFWSRFFPLLKPCYGFPLLLEQKSIV